MAWGASAGLWHSIVSDCRDACFKILSWKCQALHTEQFSLIQNQVRSTSDWLYHWEGQHSLEAEQQTYLSMHKLLVVLELVKGKMETFSSMVPPQRLSILDAECHQSCGECHVCKTTLCASSEAECYDQAWRMDCTGSTFAELQRRLVTCLDLQEFKPAALASQKPDSWPLAADKDRKAWTKEARCRLRRCQKVRIHSNDNLIFLNLFKQVTVVTIHVCQAYVTEACCAQLGIAASCAIESLLLAFDG